MLGCGMGCFNFAYSFLGFGFGCSRSLQFLGSKMEKSELKVRIMESKYL